MVVFCIYHHYNNMLTQVSTNGGAVYIANGMLVLKDNATISSNYAVNGGGIYVGNGILTIYSATVGGSSSGNRGVTGGGVYVGEYGVLRLSSSDAFVSYNSATSGANIYFASSYTAPGKVSLLSSGNIIGGNKTSETSNTPSNISSLRGAGIYIHSGNIEIRNEVRISNNVAGYGGGIYIDGGVLTLRNNTGNYGIMENSASYGGGLYVKNGNVNILGSDISNNSVTGNGAGLYLESGEVKISNTSRNASSISASRANLWTMRMKRRLLIRKRSRR